jgi:hypothetical protein
MHVVSCICTFVSVDKYASVFFYCTGFQSSRDGADGWHQHVGTGVQSSVTNECYFVQSAIICLHHSVHSAIICLHHSVHSAIICLHHSVHSAIICLHHSVHSAIISSRHFVHLAIVSIRHSYQSACLALALCFISISTHSPIGYVLKFSHVECGR